MPGCTAGVVHALGGAGQEAVGEHDLVEQAHRHERQPEAQLLRAGAPRRGELRHEFGRAHDRAGDQVREEGHEQRVVEEARGRGGAAQVHVQRVGHGGEGVERDADRQHDVVVRRVIGDPDGGQQGAEAVQQELAVLEVPQHAEVRDHGQQHPGMPRGLAARLAPVPAPRTSRPPWRPTAGSRTAGSTPSRTGSSPAAG